MRKIIAALQVSLDGFIEALFKDVEGRHALKLLEAKPLKSGMVCLTYST